MEATPLDEEPLLTKSYSGSASGGRKHLVNVFVMSFAFLGVFSAFSATQNLESSLVPGSLGYWTVATIYAAFCFGVLVFSSPLIRVLQPKWSMFIGSLCYATLMAANLKPMWSTMIPCAAALGLGASLLWPGQGSFLTAAASNYAIERRQESKSAFGLFNGIFWGIFQFSQVIGNLVGAIVLSHASGPHSDAVKILFFIFLGTALFGSFLFIFLRKEENPEQEENVPLRKKLIEPFTLFTNPKMILLWPICIFTGMEQGFFAGDFTKACITNTVGKEWIGYILCVYGAVDALSSMIIGKLADKVGKRFIVVVGLLAHLSFFLFLLIWLKIGPGFAGFEHRVWILFIIAGVYGIGDAVWNTFGGIVMSYLFTDKAEAAFSNQKLFTSLGTVTSFVWATYLPFYTKLLIVGGVLLFSCLCILILDRAVAPLDPKEEKRVN